MNTLNFCIEEAVHEGTLVCNDFLSALDTMYSKQGLNEGVAHSLLGSLWFFWSEVRDGVCKVNPVVTRGSVLSSSLLLCT